MISVIIRRYNTFFDHATGVQFNPILDKRAGLYIGLATIEERLSERFMNNPAYEIVTDEKLAEIITGRTEAVSEKSEDISSDRLAVWPGETLK